MNEKQIDLRWKRRVVLYVLVALAVTGVGLLVLSGSAAASSAANNTTVAPFYNDSDASVDNSSWMQDRREPTLDNVTHYATRLGGYIIGDAQAQDGVGPAGIFITGLVLLGVLLGATFGAGLGPVAGSALSFVAVSGLATVGFIPTWLYAICLFFLGMVAAAALIRNYR